jgi:hypothetical protein
MPFATSICDPTVAAATATITTNRSYIFDRYPSLSLTNMSFLPSSPTMRQNDLGPLSHSSSADNNGVERLITFLDAALEIVG